MSTNLPLTHMNIILFLLFVVLLGQPEHVTLIFTAMALSGSIVMHSFSKPTKHHWKTFILQDLYIHWIPALLSLSVVNFSKIGLKQFLIAAIYPLIYLSMVSYRHSDEWTEIKLKNPVKHLNELYPGADSRVYWLYYVILGSIFLASKYNR